MNNIFLIAAAILLLAGCGTTAEKIYTPSGERGYAITCSESGETWSDCYLKAGELCKKEGYEVIEKCTETRTMIIRCTE